MTGIASSALADEHDQHPAGGPPPAIVSQINLDEAGLLFSFYSNAQKGTTAGRGGRDATRIGTAVASGVTSGYQHDTNTFIPSISGSKMIQDGSAFLTFGIGTNVSIEQPNQTQFETRIPGVSIGYENFSNPKAAWSIGVTHESRTTDSDISPVVSSARSTELRFAYVRELNENWGFGNQTYVTFSDSTVSTPGGTLDASENEFYTQLEVVGSFGASEVSFVPDGWNLHPVVGVSYQNKSIDTSVGSTTEEDGSVWAKAILAKGSRPGTWAPNFTLGLEHVYLTDTGDLYIDETNYAIVGVGVNYLGDGYSLIASLERRQGLNGNRVSNTLVTGITIDF